MLQSLTLKSFQDKSLIYNTILKAKSCFLHKLVLYEWKQQKIPVPILMNFMSHMDCIILKNSIQDNQLT
jgi:hypothetical protein